jgi:Ca-activated chloride channel family protein
VSFANWPLFWVAVLCPFALLALYAHDRARRVELIHRLGELPVIGRVLASVSPRRRALKLAVSGLGLSLIVFALARPQIEGKRRVELRGLDLVVALDVSKSMLVDDVGPTEAMNENHVAPTRLARARELAAALIDELAGDRIASVVFAGAASHYPVTEDREVAKTLLYDVGPADLPPGSNLGEMFRVSLCLLRPSVDNDLECQRIITHGHGGDPLPGEVERKDDSKPDDDAIEEQEERGKAIVVLTDGGDATPEALKQVTTARALGIAVFVIGVGTPEGGVVHEIDDDGNPTSEPKHASDGSTVVSKRDDAGMKALAEAAGDEHRYLVAPARGEIDPTPFVEALRAANRGLATKKILQKRDVYQPFLFAGFMLLVIEAAIATRRRRVHPEEA